MKINKTLDIIIASEIFLLAILEFISWIVCNSEDYKGAVNGSEYLLFWYPLFCTLGFLSVGICKVIKCYRFKMCVYTKIVSVIFLLIQFVSLIALIFKPGIEIYNNTIYPIFLFAIFGITLLKICRNLYYKN